MKTTNNRLREYREELNLSKQYVAQQLKVSIQDLAAIECGNRQVQSAEMNLLSVIYGVTVEELMGERSLDLIHGSDPELSKKDQLQINSLINFKNTLKERV